MRKDASIVFFGTPQLSVWVLEELKKAGIVPALIVTAPDAPRGRNGTSSPTPVKAWATAHDIDVLEAATLRDREAVPELANSEWDLFIVAAYNKILPAWLLDLPKHGTLNVHPSLLPQLRGPSPIRSAILLDQKDAVGVTIIALDEQVDHGPIIAQGSVELEALPESEGGGWPIEGHVLDEVLFREGGRLLAEVIPLWLEGKITPEEQDHSKATFTKKFTKEDGLVDLADDGYSNYLKFCAFDGWPGTYLSMEHSSGKIRIKITQAEYQAGVFVPIRVIPEGKKEMSWDECKSWLRVRS